MNIIITGERNIGKTTALDAVLNEYDGSVAGFRTRFTYGKDGRYQELRMIDIRTGESRPVVMWDDDRPRVCKDAFDEFGEACLDCQGDLIIMDELGRFEEQAERFADAVHRAFDGGADVIAVVAKRAAGWTQELKHRGDVLLLTATEDNRDAIPGIVRESIRKL